MMKRFAGKVAMVSGAANGIGAASARRLIEEGARVALMDLDGAKLQAGFGDIQEDGCFLYAGDSTDADQVEGFFETAVSKLGPVDVLFNNTGGGAGPDTGFFEDSREETWRRVIELSLFTTMRLTRHAVPSMKARGSGRIINMSSDAAFVGDQKLGEYAAAKQGVVGFSRVLARELAPFGVTVNVIAPGAIRTAAHQRLPAAVIDQVKASTPAGFVGEPEDVAAAVVFLGSDEARFVTGQTLLVDGGRWML